MNGGLHESHLDTSNLPSLQRQSQSEASRKLGLRSEQLESHVGQPVNSSAGACASCSSLKTLECCLVTQLEWTFKLGCGFGTQIEPMGFLFESDHLRWSQR